MRDLVAQPGAPDFELIEGWANLVYLSTYAEHPLLVALEREISEVGRHIDRMIASIKDGVDPKLLVSELNNAQAKREALERQLRLSGHPDVAVLHPQAAAAYRQKVVHLQEALARGDAAALEAVTLVRGMVCEIRVTPGPERMELEVVGDLAALLEREQGLNKRDFISGCGGWIWAKAHRNRVSGRGLEIAIGRFRGHTGRRPILTGAIVARLQRFHSTVHEQRYGRVLRYRTAPPAASHGRSYSRGPWLVPMNGRYEGNRQNQPKMLALDRYSHGSSGTIIPPGSPVEPPR